MKPLQVAKEWLKKKIQALIPKDSTESVQVPPGRAAAAAPGRPSAVVGKPDRAKRSKKIPKAAATPKPASRVRPPPTSKKKSAAKATAPVKRSAGKKKVVSPSKETSQTAVKTKTTGPLKPASGATKKPAVKPAAPARKSAGKKKALAPRSKTPQAAAKTKATGPSKPASAPTKPPTTKEVAVPPPCEEGVSYSLHEHIRLVWQPDEIESPALLKSDDEWAVRVESPGAKSGAMRELVLGIDFGTSATKVVLTDKTLDKSYAVPFVDAVGVSSYLLPSTLYESESGRYSLAPEAKRHSDLKIEMLGNLAGVDECARVCAYLALVIRHSRAWVFTNLRDQYLRASLLWGVAIGQPTSTESIETLRPHFVALTKVAWSLAGKKGPVTVKGALLAWQGRAERKRRSDDLEVWSAPEVAAQIHGFVSSTHFDQKAKNLYLIVDVGAGTVDVSLFHVKKQHDAAVDFHIFTDAVDFFGAAKLNRQRLEWWRSVLKWAPRRDSPNDGCFMPGLEQAAAKLQQMVAATEYQGRYPESYIDYLSGIYVEFSNSAKDPDARWLDNILSLVRGQVLHRAWSDSLLKRDALRGVPFFLCGGGSRHPLYAKLKELLKYTRNFTWVSADHRALVKPAKLTAPGVAEADYDRLSVAYGLSRLTVGFFGKVEDKLPPDAAEEPPIWDQKFIDKSAI